MFLCGPILFPREDRLLSPRQERKGRFTEASRKMRVRQVHEHQRQGPRKPSISRAMAKHDLHGGPHVLALLLKRPASAPKRISGEYLWKIIKLSEPAEPQPHIPVLIASQRLVEVSNLFAQRAPEHGCRVGHGIRAERSGPDLVVLFRFQIRHLDILVVVDNSHAAAAAGIIGMAFEERHLLSEFVGRHPVIVVIKNRNILAPARAKP